MTENKDLKKRFSNSVEQAMGSLYRVALRLLKNRADAEDLVADAIVKAWASYPSLEDNSRFRPWIFRILHNCFIDNYRKKTVRVIEESYDEQYVDYDSDEVLNVLFNQTDEFLYWWANPEREIANKLLGEQIMAAIDSLPEAFRVTIVLVNVECLSYDDAAEILGVPPGTVRSRMKRGRTLLQKALWTQARDHGLIGRENLRVLGVGE